MMVFTYPTSLPLDDLPLDQWVFLEKTYIVPEFAPDGSEIWAAQPGWNIDLGADNQENLDGRLVVDDVFWGLTPDPAGGLAADFDGNGTVEFADFVILSNTFGQSVGVTSVPEPVTLTLLGLAACLSVGTSRKRRN